MPTPEDKILPEDVDADYEEEEETDEEDQEEEEEGEDQDQPGDKGEDDGEDEEGEQDDEDDEDDDEKLIPMKQYKQLQRAASVGVQKVLEKNKILDKAFGLLTSVAEKPESLLTIHEEDPRVAQVILDKYYDGISIEEYAESWLGTEYTPKKPAEAPIDAEAIRKEEREKIQQELVDEHVERLFDRAKLTKEEKQKVQEEYNDLSEGKKLTKEKATKYFQIAYSLVRRTPAEDPITKSVKHTAPSSKSGPQKKTKAVDPYLKDAEEFLDENGYY